MFVKFVCFVRLGFILTHYSFETNYASVLWTFRRIKQTHCSSQTNDVSSAYFPYLS